jgi:hypothetical protein
MSRLVDTMPGRTLLNSYRERELLPYLLPPSWLEQVELKELDGNIAILAEDETGNPLRQPIVMATGRSPDLDMLCDRMCKARACGVRLVVTGVDEDLGQLAGCAEEFRRETTWTCMGADLDPLPTDSPAERLVERPDLADGARELWNSCGFARPISPEAFASIAAWNPLWAPENTLVVGGDDGAVGAVVRLHPERDASGEPFAFIRGLAIAADLRRSTSIQLLRQLYSGIRSRLAELQIRRCHLKVETHNEQLRKLYSILGFRAEGLVHEWSV